MRLVVTGLFLLLAPLAWAGSHSKPTHDKPSPAGHSAEVIAHGKKNNCVGSACMAMGHKDLARAFNQLRAKVNSGRGITDSQFRDLVDKFGLQLHDFAEINDKGPKGITQFRDTVKRAVGNNEKDYFVNFADHMEAISKGNKPDILLEHFKRTGSAKFMEVTPKGN